jgi:hypothetical protein
MTQLILKRGSASRRCLDGRVTREAAMAAFAKSRRRE